MYRATDPVDDGLVTCPDSPSRAERLQRRLTRWHRRFGTSAIVVATTVVSVLLSLVFTGIALWFVHLAGDLTYRLFVTSMVIELFVPLLVAPLASQLLVSLLVELDRVNDQLSVQTRTDVLTDVLNRRGFFAHAGPLLARVPDEDVLLCMVDVNDFKLLNDEYGHDQGDRALVHLADRMTKAVGPEGIVGRLGGDEFALVIPGQRDTTSFRAGLAEAFTAIQLPDGPVFSASCGVTLLLPGDSLDGALTRADVDLYQVKAARASAETVRTPPTPRSVTRVDADPPRVVAHTPRHRRV